jgi:hypothetical protein
MRNPADPPRRDPAADATRRRADQDPDQDSAPAFWQWVAIGVFVICWLAEAAFCAARGP